MAKNAFSFRQAGRFYRETPFKLDLGQKTHLLAEKL
jgi:hypothetical protein